jgi:hypothetical protein
MCRLAFVKLVVAVVVARLGIVMSTSHSDLDDANDDSRKRQDRTDHAKDDGYRESV